ncbi:hypothetical protein DLE60_21100 [Micromonospora globispora]|uniref:beta-glucosidase n=1 Tax=Micromonospora globispora TaxID=1450148 RepID=A0A317K9S6_9ACTN|nr:glycoside hydrolase family 3 N-terminal domain-containing protein [Micromonospora globispora]PWU50233.1 hypothetical protein DLJ46_07525 [Micromonospora globispora]PWU58557.1 hypothetical protein DLE60_21100 [Micromonospora globispora]RQW83777.1 hypothetical protein DKL51_31225 [Micromonospora globispora]
MVGSRGEGDAQELGRLDLGRQDAWNVRPVGNDLRPGSSLRDIKEERMHQPSTRFWKRSGVLLAAALPLSLLGSTAVTGAPSSGKHGRWSNGAHGPVIEGRVKDLIKVDGRYFKDLNDNGRLDRYEDWRLSPERRADDLLSRMTLEEKAGLMQITSAGRGNAPPSDPLADTVGYINDRHIRYLILRDNPSAHDLADRSNDYQQIAEATRLGIPVVFTSNPRNHVSSSLEFGISEASGQFSLWPGSLGLAAMRDSRLVREFAEIARQEWVASGIRKAYAYQIETATEPRWRRISGTFGEDPELNADIAKQLVLGFQGNRLGNQSVAQTVKHFPGDGAVLRGLDPHNEPGKWAIYPTPGSFFKYQLPPFQAAVDAGTSAIMSYYNVPSNAMSSRQFPDSTWYSEDMQFEEVAGAYNKVLLTDLLRGKMGFDGYVNSDSGVLTSRAFGVENLSIEERFTKSIRAGVSLFSDNNDPSGLISAVNTGRLKERELNPSVKMLLTEIFTLGLFENPYVDPNRAQQIADSPRSQAKADEAQRKSIVLLRNDEKALPFTDAVAAKTKLYVEVFDGDDSATQTAALRKIIAEKEPAVQLVDTPEAADAGFVWVRPTPYEYPDNSTVEIQLNELTGVDVNRIKQIEAAVPTILTINMTNPWVINEIEPQAAAVVATFDVTPEALLDVIRGRFNPSGKLPITIPANQAAVERNASDVPGYAEKFDYTYTNMVGHDYKFGFGLSYPRR